MRYLVQVTEVLQKVIEVDVDSAESAVNKVRNYYRNSKIVLDSSDCISHSVEVLNEV